MNNVVYSSENACDNITRRELRALDDIMPRLKASKFTQDLLFPLGKRIASAGRLKRGMLKAAVTKVERQLRSEVGVIDVEVEHYAPSRLSSNEGARMAFVTLMSEGEHWLQFYLTEAVMTRKDVTVRSSEADVLIHRHALSRYMQRERRPFTEMYGEIMDAVRAAPLIAEAAVKVSGNQIAVAMGDGLFLGRLRTLNWAQAPAYIERIKMSAHAADHMLEDRPDMGETPSRVVVEIMTYVDHNSLTDAREELRDVLTEFQQRRSFEAKVLFDATYFKAATIPADVGQEQVQEMIFQAVEEADKLVECPAWVDFVTTAPKQFA